MVPCCCFAVAKINAAKRERIRQQFSIREKSASNSLLSDFEASYCLSPCAIFQQLRQLESMGVGVGGRRNMIKHGHHIKPVYQYSGPIKTEKTAQDSKVTPVWYQGRVPRGLIPVDGKGAPVQEINPKISSMLVNPPVTPRNKVPILEAYAIQMGANLAPPPITVSGGRFGDSLATTNTMEN
jgi:hypothetical protein